VKVRKIEEIEYTQKVEVVKKCDGYIRMRRVYRAKND
jgi:hypothetical protein